MAKEKVGQAKADTEDVQRKMQKALEDIKLIISELDSMKEISVSDLNGLGKLIFCINIKFYFYFTI